MIYLFLVPAMLLAFASAPPTVLRLLARVVPLLMRPALTAARVCLAPLASVALLLGLALVVAWQTAVAAMLALAYLSVCLLSRRLLVAGLLSAILAIAFHQPKPTAPARHLHKTDRGRFLPSPPQHLVSFFPRPVVR